MAGMWSSKSRTVSACPRSAAARAIVSATDGHGRTSVDPTSKKTASTMRLPS